MSVMHSPQPPVSVIVLTYNGKAFLRDCLDSILGQDYPGVEVILVDNGSKDGTATFVREHYPSVRLLRLESNTGFAGGNNRAVEVASHDLIVLVNNDVIVEPGWLAGLVEGISEEGVGQASSRCIEAKVPPIYYMRNGTINYVGRNVMLAFSDPRDLFYCTGCSVIYRKSEYGLPFDDDYFLYAEDTYFGLRVRFSGKKPRHCESSRLRHLGSASTSRERRSLTTYYQERNRILNTLVFFGLTVRIRLYPYIAIAFLGTLAHGLVRSRRTLPGVLRAYGWLMTHPRVIAGKRRAMKPQKAVPDREVLRYMSCRLLDGDSLPTRIINGLSFAYTKLVGLPAIEHWSSGWQREFVRQHNTSLSAPANEQAGA